MLNQWVSDCAIVFRWNPYLYRRVLHFGLIFGFLIGTFLSIGLTLITLMLIGQIK